MRLRPTGQVKKSTISTAAIQNNELAVFIDTKNKIVTLPEDVKDALKLKLEFLKTHQKLAYSHQKEHIIRILFCQTRKNRTSRVEKIIEKNPL